MRLKEAETNGRSSEQHRRADPDHYRQLRGLAPPCLTDDVGQRKTMSHEGTKSWLKAYENFGRQQLLLEMARWIPESDQHRAAAIMIDELDRREAANVQKEEERRHREIVRVAKVGYLIAGVAAAAAIASAWYAKSQAESAALSALSARASAASIVSQPALPATSLPLPIAAPSATGIATPKP